MSFKTRFTSFNWHNAEDNSLPKKISTSVGSGTRVTSVETEGSGEGCLNRFKILLQSLTLTLQVYWLGAGGDHRLLRTGTLVARGGATSPHMLSVAVASPAWRTRSSWSAGGNSKWSRGRAEPASSPRPLPPLPSGGDGRCHRCCRCLGGHLGACGAAWLLPRWPPLGARRGGGEERDIHSNTRCTRRRARASAGGGSPRAPAARGARRPAAPARRARARVALAVRVRLSGKPSPATAPTPPTLPGRPSPGKQPQNNRERRQQPRRWRSGEDAPP